MDSNSNFPCLMSKTFRKKYIQHVEERLKILFKPFDSAKQITYKQFITYQVKVLKSAIQNKQINYRALKIR